jgi:hypothetical protein
MLARMLDTPSPFAPRSEMLAFLAECGKIKDDDRYSQVLAGDGEGAGVPGPFGPKGRRRRNGRPKRREAKVAETLNGFADEAACARVFEYGEFGRHAYGLRELGPWPLQSGLTEFWPSVSVELSVTSTDSNTPAECEFKVRDWMEGTQPEIETLEAAVGTRLFHFAKPGIHPTTKVIGFWCWIVSAT